MYLRWELKIVFVVYLMFCVMVDCYLVSIALFSE